MAEESIWDDDLLKSFSRVQDDADSAMAACRNLLGDTEVRRLPAKVQSTLKTALAECRKACDDFVDALNGDDPKKVAPVFLRMTLRLAALQVLNKYVSSLAESAVASRGIEMLTALVLVGRDAQRYVSDSEKRIKELRDKLKGAIKAVRNAKIQTALNVALSLVVLGMTEIEAVSAARVAILSMTGHFEIDALLGPKGIDAPGAAVTVIGDISDSIKKLREVLTESSKKLIGAASMVVTLGLNAKEVQEAKAAVEEVKEAIEKAQEATERLADQMKSAFAKLPALERKLDRAIKEARQAVARSRDAAEDYSNVSKNIAEFTR